MNERKQCLFCPILDPTHPETWSFVHEGCFIDGVPSCQECTIVVAIYDDKFKERLLKEVEARQAQAREELKDEQAF